MKAFLLLLLIFSFSFAQNASPREWKIFRKGVSDYKAGEYETARQSFSLMLNKLPDNALATANWLMLAKCNYKLDDYDVSLRQCEEFKQKFPASSYLDDINYLAANNYYRLGRIEEAVETWLETGYSASDPVLQKRAFNIADDVISYRINRLTLEKMASQNQDKPIYEALKYYIANKAWRDGKRAQAQSEIDEIIDNPRNSVYSQRIRELSDLLKGKVTGTLKLAALLPLSGSNAEIGKSLLGGLKLGLKEFNNNSKLKIELEEFDYGTRLVEALKQTKKIASDPHFVAVFGPVENDIFAACAALADYEDLTIISPTASDGSVADISQNAIQLAPTVDIMARALEDYVSDSLRVKRAAILAPVDDYYYKMTESFKNEFELSGGIVEGQAWYYPGDQDFKKQFRALKRTGLRLEFADSILLEKPDANETYIDSLYKIYQKEQREALKETKTKLDSADIPVVAYDVLFMPIFADDISFVAAQFAYSNIRAQLLGNSDWYNPEELRKNRTYINGIVFAADGYLNEEGWDYRQFRNNYRNNLKTTPGKYELIAYDCTNFLLSVFNKDNPVTRQNILMKLLEKDNYKGIYRTISLNRKGQNKSVQLLKYIFGQIIPVN